MKEPKCYYVRYYNRGDKEARTHENGPWDYYHNALWCRNQFFEQTSGVVACWIQESPKLCGPTRGKMLRRL